MEERPQHQTVIVQQEGSPWFWKLFGGAVIGSITVLLMVIFNGVNNHIVSVRSDATSNYNELRNEIASLKERIGGIENSRESTKEKLNSLEGAIKERAQQSDLNIQKIQEVDKEQDKKIQELREQLLKLENNSVKTEPTDNSEK